MTIKDPKAVGAIKLNGRVSKMRTVPPRGAAAVEGIAADNVMHIRSRKRFIDPSTIESESKKPRANVQRLSGGTDQDATVLDFPKVTAKAIDIVDTSLLPSALAASTAANLAEKKSLT